MEKTVKTIIDHNEIRKWIETRAGKPAIVQRTIYNDAEADPGVLQVVFPGATGSARLEEITWGRFFLIFEEKNLAFACKDDTNEGKPSYFFDFIPRPGSKRSVTNNQQTTA